MKKIKIDYRCDMNTIHLIYDTLDTQIYNDYRVTIMCSGHSEIGLGNSERDYRIDFEPIVKTFDKLSEAMEYLNRWAKKPGFRMEAHSFDVSNHLAIHVTCFRYKNVVQAR